jgi:hypothetical protein
MTLCALFETRDRLRRSERALEQSWNRLAATQGLTQSARSAVYQLQPRNKGCLSIPLGMTPQHTTEARPFNLLAYRSSNLRGQLGLQRSTDFERSH